MSDINTIPELKQIIGALLFAAREPVPLDTIKKVFKDVAKNYEGAMQDFAKATREDILAAIDQLNKDLSQHHTGIHVGEVANGYRLQNDLNCGLWIRTMLEKGRSNRLSKPALETLAIIAYRQPCTRSEIEAVRGVAVDAIMKNLMELQLIKAVGRSELPGRPWLFATTQKFLEYFGLKDIKDLPGVEELRRIEKEQAKTRRNEAVEEGARQGDLPQLSEPDSATDEIAQSTGEATSSSEEIADEVDEDEEAYEEDEFDDDEEYDEEDEDDEDDDEDEDIGEDDGDDDSPEDEAEDTKK